MKKTSVNTLHLEIYAEGEVWDSPIGIRVFEGVELFKDRPSYANEGKKFFYNLGKKTAGYGAVCTKGLELVIINQTEEIDRMFDMEDIREFAKAIAEFHYYRVGVRIASIFDKE